jgi:FlaA1/EpsC-like NDP-sugar epimerase
MKIMINNGRLQRPSANLFFMVAMDAFVVIAAFVGAYLLRYDFQLRGNRDFSIRNILALLVIKLLCFYFFRLYRGLWRYTSLKDLLGIIKATLTASGIGLMWFFLVQRAVDIARTVFVIDWMVTFLGVTAIRLAIRLYFQRQRIEESDQSIRRRLVKRRLLIIGAGNAGEQVLREMLINRRLAYDVVGFLDDDKSKRHRIIHGVEILGGTGELDRIIQERNVEEILIAIPSATSRQMRRLVELCESSGLPYRTVPGFGELIDGTKKASAIRQVSYEDLMGRDTIRLDAAEIGKVLAGKCALVTGAGGSIGSELCRQLTRFNPRELILLDRTENNLYHIELEIRRRAPALSIQAELVDIQAREQLTQVMNQRRPDVVFHAAAFKHVPMMELNPWEAVTNNILGTSNVLRAANGAGVRRFVMVSSDKAVRPTNVMGASKRVAELLTISNGNIGMRCMNVRFGNVVGSEGSVIPLFKRQIERGGPVTVTHPDAMRYFMTIPEAAQLILQAGAMGAGGETFILKMGEPINILDLAKDLIRLSGFAPGEDIDITFVGLRPGEKLKEELITEGEGIVSTEHEQIMVLRGQECDQNQLGIQIKALELAAAQRDADQIRRHLKEIVPEYVPYEGSKNHIMGLIRT